MAHETAFEFVTATVRYGAGVTAEIGVELTDRGVARVLVVTDPTLRHLPPVQAVFDSLAQHGLAVALFDGVSIEPTDHSFQAAIDAAGREAFDAIVAVGGGSTIDTAKAINLYTSCPPAEFRDYVNPPVGKGLAVPRELKPLLAVPTTAGPGARRPASPCSTTPRSASRRESRAAG